MMKAVIVEDEKPAVENLLQCLQNIDEPIKVTAVLTSVKAAIEWFQTNESPDFIMMDIQLTDGLSFNIFKAVDINCPVIFITAYDKYLTDAFEYNSIDYLLKPVEELKLKNTIKKYKHFEKHFLHNQTALLDYLDLNKKKTRVLVRKGSDFLTIRLEHIAYFFTEHKIVFLVDKDRKKFMAEKKTLAEIEEDLDDKTFFRANRKYIINLNYISSFKTIDNSKILIELNVPANEEIIVSQENASNFKKWVSEN